MPEHPKLWSMVQFRITDDPMLQIDSNLNRSRYVCEVLQPEVVPFLQSIPWAIFQQDNACPYVVKTVRDFCSTQNMQLLSCPAYSPVISPIVHVWDLADRLLARHPCPAASKDELWLCIQAVWNSLPRPDIQNLFDSMPLRIAALIVVRSGYTKY